MPSPAALAKYVMAFVVAAPFNPEGMDTLPDRGGINYQVNHGGRNTAPNHGGMNYEVNHAAINTPAYHTGMQAPIDLRDPYIAGTSGLYLCVDGGFTGYCRYFTAPHGQCSKSILPTSPCLLPCLPLFILCHYVHRPRSDNMEC